jgi:hypothetical protein
MIGLASGCSIYFLNNDKVTRDGILGHQFYKKDEYFPPCYSQSLILADNKKTILYTGFNNSYKNLRNKKSSLCLETSIKNVIHEFHLWKFFLNAGVS